MRKGTKAFVSIVSLGVIAAGYQAGLAAQVSNGFSASAPVVEPNATTTPATPVATSSPTSSPSSGSNGGQSAAPTATPGVSGSSAPAPVSTPKATTSTAPAPADPAPITPGISKTGDAVQYRYGTAQVAVTKSNGKITAVNLLQEGATGGRQAAFTYLAELAVKANGSGFGNLSGATYTTDAFKQSLESALAKF